MPTKTYAPASQNILSIGKAAEYLGVSIDTLRRWGEAGKLKEYRSPGNHRYYKLNDLDKLFDTKYERARTPPADTENSRSKDQLKEKKETTQSTNERPKFSDHDRYKDKQIGKIMKKNIPPDEPPPPPPPQKPSLSQQVTPVSPLTQEVPHEQQVEIEDTFLTANKEEVSEKDIQAEKILGNKTKKTNNKKIILIAFILFTIIDAVIFYIWFSSRTVISPIP